MIRPEQVTNEMVRASLWAMEPGVNTTAQRRKEIAAALTAMPDNLLRELARERGCVMVEPKHLKDLIGEYWNIAYREGCERRSHDTQDGDAQRVWGEICAMLSAAETPAVTTPTSERNAGHE